MRLKTEINAWDKVAERHPYSVYRKNELPLYMDARTNDPFTTSFGEGLPFRTYDRNERARTAASAVRTMEQPYPRGYTGHVGKIRHVVGQTYGKQVREAINSVTPKVELAEYRSDVLSVNPTGGIPCAAPASEATVSTQQLSFKPPDEQVAEIHRSVLNGVSTRRPVDLHSRYASTQQLSYLPPPPKCYATPGWSERPTSNIGQPDVYKHAKKLQVHERTLPKKIASLGGTMDKWPDPKSSFLMSTGAAASMKSASSLQGTITKHSDVEI